MLGILAAMLIAFSADEIARPHPIGQLVHTRWTTLDGAPGDIRALAQSGDGYLWLGTATGLFRFDGVRFVHFVPQAGDSLPGTAVSRLMSTRDGALWIIWPDGGVSRLRDGRITSWGERDGLPPAFQLAESHQGMLLAGTAKGLARFSDGGWHDLGAAWELPGQAGRAIWFDRSDVLWVQTDRNIAYLPASGEHFVNPGMIVRDRPSPAEFAQAQDGAVWMNELARSAHTLRVVGDSAYPTEVRVRSTTLLVDRRGSLWVGTAGDGLRRLIDPPHFRGKVISRFGAEAEQFTTKDGLLSDITTALLEDHDGSIWVASSAGVECFREGTFTPIAPVGPTRARFVFAARDTAVWSASEDHLGVLRITPRDTATVPTDFVVTNLAQDSAGSLYTVRTHRLLKYAGNGFSPVPVRRNVGINLVDLTVDRDGTLWLYDEDVGLLHLEGDRLVTVPGLYEPIARRGVLFSDRKGRIWVGQLNRVALYDHGQLKMLERADGVPPGQIDQVLEDRVGDIWIVGDGGVSKFDNGRFRTVPEGGSVPGRRVFGVAEDREGAWWMATQSGVLRVAAGEFDRALNDSTYELRFRTFDQHDGLPGKIAMSGWRSPVTRAADGRIWVATDSGFAVVDPHSLPRDPPRPVLIEAVRIDGGEVPRRIAARIPAGRHDLEIDFTTTDLAHPAETQFRYKLDGDDHTWHNVGTQRRVTFRGLGGGDYRFRVASRNSDGDWDEQGSLLAFRVLPPWYQTWWFGIASVAMIAAFGAASAATVQRQRHAREQEALRSQYEATLAERGRIAQDLHDTLLQGFVGVTLQLRAAELALPTEPDVAGDTIRRVQRLARESLREARERVWDMAQSATRNGDLPSALETMAKERASGTDIELSVRVVGELRPLGREIADGAFRIGREAIANAIRHADARRLEIVVTYSERSVRLEVRDDGKGFTPHEAEESRRRGHFGLSGARERATHLGGRCDIHARPGGGTIISLELPRTEPPSTASAD